MAKISAEERRRYLKDNFSANIAAHFSSEPIKIGLSELCERNDLSDPLVPGPESRSFCCTLASDQISHFLSANEFLSSSINSLISNRKDNAVHFAYYAQLRAVHSLLAYSGISMRNRKVGYIDKITGKDFKKSCDWGTHEVTWPLWDKFTKSGVARDLLSGIYIYRDVSLSATSKVFFGSSYFAAELQRFGRDLMSFSDTYAGDHRARNDASYKPLRARQGIKEMSGGDVQFCGNLWDSFFDIGDCSSIDVALAMRVIEDAAAQKLDIDPTSDIEQWKGDKVEVLAHDCGVDKAGLARLLTENVSPDCDNIIVKARMDDDKAEYVISRALLLLRFAMIGTDKLLTFDTDGNLKRFIFDWLKSIGVEAEDDQSLPDEKATYLDLIDDISDSEVNNIVDINNSRIFNAQLFSNIAISNAWRLRSLP